ncbi:MAG TPA: hypothetical protein VFR63_05690 [Gaiellaceae bacterium]|nr:hypothetical protein [Gaiellaceae bacterium]
MLLERWLFAAGSDVRLAALAATVVVVLTDWPRALELARAWVMMRSRPEFRT